MQRVYAKVAWAMVGVSVPLLASKLTYSFTRSPTAINTISQRIEVLKLFYCLFVCLF